MIRVLHPQMDVILTWDRVKKVPNYAAVVGDAVLDRALRLQPAIAGVYRLPEDDYRSQASYARHAAAVVRGR